jgi:hypothetical protein
VCTVCAAKHDTVISSNRGTHVCIRSKAYVYTLLFSCDKHTASKRRASLSYNSHASMYQVSDAVREHDSEETAEIYRPEGMCLLCISRHARSGAPVQCAMAFVSANE